MTLSPPASHNFSLFCLPFKQRIAILVFEHIYEKVKWVVAKLYPNAMAPDSILVSNLFFPSLTGTQLKKYETTSLMTNLAILTS